MFKNPMKILKEINEYLSKKKEEKVITSNEYPLHAELDKDGNITGTFVHTPMKGRSYTKDKRMISDYQDARADYIKKHNREAQDKLDKVAKAPVK